uniref:Rop guanine nucleotide exchange factor 14 n=1 Tax=Tanacetum cinerariifolium TaxID=118510 RepID=A0A6L2LEA8_TANCI|nr:Rop guanine nucleotide exchange factor 14 [Tanacetum cinerariifolium]
MEEADVILVSTLMDTSEKLMPNNDQAVSQLEYPRVISCLMYTMTCTRPDIEFVVGKLSSAATLAKAYSQMYNGKSRQLGDMHSMIRELITNGVISIEFLIPAKKCGADGRTLEIMTPKARGDVHLNLLALQNLDSMLLKTLDSMTETEFWYEEGGSRAEGRSRNLKQSKRWWLLMPQVPIGGLSDGERKKLLNQAKLVHQIFKATKTINESILLEMPVTKIIGEALPK